MKSLRSLVGFILALALSGFAAPSIAASKTFDLAATATVAVNQSIDVTFTNRDDGNSSFNSVSIAGDPTAGTLEIVSASQSGSNKRGNYTISADKKSIVYTDLSPIKVNNPLTVTLVVKTSTPGCNAGSIRWTGSAWTGSPSTPSNPFSTADSPTTTITSPGCTAQFVTSPKNAVIDQRITGEAYKPAATEVQVKLMSGTQAVAGAWVDLTSTCSQSGALTLSAASVQTGSDGIAKFVALESSTAGAGCALKATRRDFTSATATSGAFAVVNAAATFSPTPTSVSVEKPSTITVKLVVVGSNPEQVIAQSGSGSLQVISGACTADAATITTTNGVLNFSVQGVTVGSTCTLKATGDFGGVAFGNGFELTVSGVKVYTGVLACDDVPFDALGIPAYDPNDPTTFNASPAGVTSSAITAFIVGARSRGDPAKGDDCGKNINFTVVNNVPNGSIPSTDPLNNVVPAGGWSFTWDLTVPNPVVGVITTYRSEWANSEGVSDKRVWICTETPCPGSRIDFPLAWKKLEYCLSTLVTHSSIPAGEAACQARLVETVISAIETSVYCTGTPPDPPANAPAGWAPRCIQPTVYSIIGKDPVFER